MMFFTERLGLGFTCALFVTRSLSEISVNLNDSPVWAISGCMNRETCLWWSLNFTTCPIIYQSCWVVSKPFLLFFVICSDHFLIFCVCVYKITSDLYLCYCHSWSRLLECFTMCIFGISYKFLASLMIWLWWILCNTGLVFSVAKKLLWHLPYKKGH